MKPSWFYNPGWTESMLCSLKAFLRRPSCGYHSTSIGVIHNFSLFSISPKVARFSIENCFVPYRPNYKVMNLIIENYSEDSFLNLYPLEENLFLKGGERSQSSEYYPPAFWIWKIDIGAFTMMGCGTLPIIRDHWKEYLGLSKALKILRFSVFQPNWEDSGAPLKPFDVPEQIGFVEGVRLQRRRSCVLSPMSFTCIPCRNLFDRMSSSSGQFPSRQISKSVSFRLVIPIFFHSIPRNSILISWPIFTSGVCSLLGKLEDTSSTTGSLLITI